MNPHQLVRWALLAVLTVPASAQVLLLADVGYGQTTVKDGPEVRFFAQQPGILLQPEWDWYPTIGVRAGPAVVIASETRDFAAGAEARLLLGGGWRWRRIQVDGMVGWGGGFWYDADLLAGNDWSRTRSGEIMVTWSLDERLRLGPGISWSSRQLTGIELEERRASVVVLYRMD